MPAVPHWNQRTPLNSAIFGVENIPSPCSPLGTAEMPIYCSPLEPLITSSIGSTASEINRWLKTNAHNQRSLPSYTAKRGAKVSEHFFASKFDPEKEPSR